MRTLSIDIETFSSVDLTKAGAYAYAAAPDFSILLFSYAYGDDPVQVVDLAQGECLPAEVRCDLVRADVLKTAYNANFERTCLAAYLRMAMPPEQWQCTAVLAAQMGLPRSLEAVGAALGLEGDEAKDKQGKALIRYFSMPCKPTETNGGRTRNLPCHAPDKWRLYKMYNARDVEVERRIRGLLRPMPTSEWRLWQLDQRINDRGVRVDRDLVEHAITCDNQAQNARTAAAARVTGLSNPKSNPQIKRWIAGKEGFTEDFSLNKAELASLRERCSDPEVLAYLDMRGDLNKTSVSKYKAIARAVCPDGRVRGALQFYGANRTGRWAGRILQPQNLPQNHLIDLDLARQLLAAGDTEEIELLFGSVPGTLSQLIRTALIPSPGRRFIVADFSAIEARVIAWMAREKWRLDVFNTHGKIYEASASAMFRVPLESIHKGDPLRQKGKVAELALGYGGGPGAMVNMGALRMGLTEEELPGIVRRWRNASPHIVRFWWEIDAMARQAIAQPGTRQRADCVSAIVRDDVLYFRLPSGRELAYVSPRLEDDPARGGDKITYMGVDQKSGGWGRLDTYGPKLVENLVQATARDCLAHAMLQLEEAGHEIVFHVHDEVVVDEPEGGAEVEEIVGLMCRPAPWMSGLPLRADGYACRYYRKD